MYWFANVVPGAYRVQFVQPLGFSFASPPNSLLAGDDTFDSDAVPQPGGMTGVTEVYQLVGGQYNETIDAGYYNVLGLASVGDFVWDDLDGDGQQDSGEPGIQSVTVILTGAGGDNQFGNGNETIVSTTTGSNGEYLFTNLAPDQYLVTFSDLPPGYVFTTPNVGDDTSDSDADPLTGTTGIYVLNLGDSNMTVDAGAYLPIPGIDIEKTTNGPSNTNPIPPTYDNEDTANGVGVPVLTPWSVVNWTYKVTNTGNVAFAFAEVVVSDDNGTLGIASDDLSTTNGKITFGSVYMGNSDNILEPGEMWLYHATGTVQTLLVPGSGASTTFDFQGSSATDGTDGNMRTFTAGSLSVKASAFSRDDTSGAWLRAYVGSYSGGLGVTDSSEGSGSSDRHTLDNVGGRDNYVLFEFSQSVIIDAAFLGYVITDSDLTYWIGTKTDPFNNHLTLSDSLLASLEFTEVNLTSSTTTRTADLNAANLSGNVLIIAALVDEATATANDKFKIQNLTIKPSVPGVYANKGVATVPGATDNDMSHYKNPLPPSIAIIKDVVGSTIVAQNTPVKYSYSVSNTGGVPLSSIVVTDDHATPKFPGDDFNPTPTLQTSGPHIGKNTGDLNGDSKLDTTEVWKYCATVIPPVVMTVTTSTGAAPLSSGVLSYVTLANGDIRVFYLQDNNFNDNTYGTGSDIGWTSKGKTHKFSDLTGSDKAGFLVTYSDGTTLAKFYQDYITWGGTNTEEGYAAFSGYQSLGISGGDGSFVSGNSAVLKDFDSTLETNMNQAGTASNGVAYKAMTYNSPVNDSKWTVINGYSFVIDKSAFTTKSFGGVSIFDQHNSPAKSGGSNSYIPKIVGGSSVNTAMATGIGNGTIVEDDDDATVSIITGPLGSLGDRVWFDSNANGIQNSGEPGIVGVKVNLTGDFDMNGTIDYTATMTTGADGVYKFSGLPAGEYFVTVDVTTLPANYVQTWDLDGLATLNRAVGKLAAGQNRTDFDFGYILSAPGFSLVKTANKTTAAFGESVTYTYVVSNGGTTALTNVVLKDDNGTPSDPTDDFSPVKVSGDTVNVGTLDPGENWTYTATVTPPIQLSANNVNGYTGPAGMLTSQKLANGDYRITYLQSTNVNDNVYGTSATGVWPGGNHTFSHLTGSDKAGFELKNASGTTVMKFYIDYISAATTQETTGEYASYSGYRSLGATGGDGSISIGSSASLYNFDSTLEVNLNRAGYTTAIVNSPVNDPNWNVVNGYSFTVKAAAFGTSTLGSVSIFDQHNSPSKLGVNSFVPTPSGGAVTNIAVVTALLNGSTVAAANSATVLVGPAAGGATKFFVVDTGVDDTFRYSTTGASLSKSDLQSGNTDPRDVASNADGSKLWVVDKDKYVNVYNGNGTAQGLWKADGLGSEPEGITLDGSDLWIADRDRKIHWYDNAAGNTSGTDSADRNFTLWMSGNLKGIVTNGTSLWVVTEGGTDYVYRFAIIRDSSGNPTGLTQNGKWTLVTANSKPTGITLDPSGASQSLWIVDESSDSVYEYSNARNWNSGAGTVKTSFKLASTNLAPQGIADPPPVSPVSSPAITGSTSGFSMQSRELIAPPLANHNDRRVRQDRPVLALDPRPRHYGVEAHGGTRVTAAMLQPDTSLTHRSASSDGLGGVARKNMFRNLSRTRSPWATAAVLKQVGEVRTSFDDKNLIDDLFATIGESDLLAWD